MANVKVTALKGFRFRGNLIETDQELSVPVKVANTWAKIGKVSMEKEVAAKVETQLAAPAKKKA